jgi:o-succinylbenzoate synthase
MVPRRPGGAVTPDVIRAALHRVRLPLRRAHRAAHGEEAVRDLVLVEVERADGVVGWGECSALARPTYSSEHTAGAWLVLRDHLLPASLAGRSSDVVGHPMASAALASALLDARLREAGVGLAAHLARVAEMDSRPVVGRTAVVGLHDEVDGVLVAVERHLDGGAEAVKLKITPHRAQLDALRAVRSSWPELAVAVDWNGSADDEALVAADAVGLTYHEQPAPAHHLVASARFAARVETPVALDESIEGIGSLEAVVALGAGTIVNLKPARAGGPEGAVAMLAQLRSLGLGWFVGGMLESGIGRAAALAVAALADDRTSPPTDLGPSQQYFDLDVAGPVVVDASGRLQVPARPGIGVDVHRSVLDEVRTDHLELS